MQRFHFKQCLDCWLSSVPCGCSRATRELSTSISLWSSCPSLFPKGRIGYLRDTNCLSISARGNHFRATHLRFSLGSVEVPAWEVAISSCNHEMLCLHSRILCFCPNAHSSVSLLLQHCNIISTLNSGILILLSPKKKGRGKKKKKERKNSQTTARKPSLN